MAVHPSPVENLAFDEDYYDTSAPDPESTARLAEKHTTEGYREGISTSKQQYIQEGFDEGYILGAALGLKVGELLGVLEGIVGTINGQLASAKDTEGDKGNDLLLKEQLSKQRKVRETARQELALENVFGREYFGEDGIWKWTTEDEDDRTFDDIVLLHPLVVKWGAIVRKQAEEFDLEIGIGAEVAADEALSDE